MTSPLSTATELGKRRLAFYVVVGSFVVLFGAITGPELAFLFTGWFPGTDLGPHRLHQIVIAATLWAVLLGMLVQLHAPETSIGGVYQTALVVLAVFVGGAVGGFFLPPVLIFLVLAIVAAALHPAGRDVVRVLTPRKLDRWLLALVIVAAVPLLLFAANQTALQLGTAGHSHAEHAEAGSEHEKAHQEHIDEGHFASMTGLAFAIIALGLLASLRPPGWWLPAWTAGGMAVVYGLASTLFPDLASSAGTLWGGLAVLWGMGLVATAELTQEEGASSPLARWRTDRAKESGRGTGE